MDDFEERVQKKKRLNAIPIKCDGSNKENV